MAYRIALLDRVVCARTLVECLAAEGASVALTVTDVIPEGPGIVALLVGPNSARVTDAHLAALPDLRVLSATCTGYDHLPTAAARARGIRVTQVADYCTEEVADHALACILGLLRATAFLDSTVRAGLWGATSPPPRRIAGTVLGLYGLGKIGAAVGRRARALDIDVLACGPSLGRRGPELAAEGITAVEWPELLRRANVLSLHAPLTDQTRGVVDAAALAMMAPGSYLVNVARAGLVDHDALGSALRSGRLAGAAIDVLPHEPVWPDDPILRFPNIMLTPHVAFYSPGVAEKLARRVAVEVAGALGDPAT